MVPETDDVTVQVPVATEHVGCVTVAVGALGGGGAPTVLLKLNVQPLVSVIVPEYVAAGRFEKVVLAPAEIPECVTPPNNTLYGPWPPKGVTVIEPVVVQVALVILNDAFTPAFIDIAGSVPHLGLMVEEFSEAHVLDGDASVHARKRFVSLKASPHR